MSVARKLFDQTRTPRSEEPISVARGQCRQAVVLATLVLCSLCTRVWAQAASENFQERPGILEFSGRMIVRPLQSSALHDRGLSAVDINTCRERAAARLRPQLIEYVPATDEYVVTLPPGETENTFAAMLRTTGDYEYAVPDWRCFLVSTTPNDPAFRSQWHHKRVRSALAWDVSTGNSGLIIAVVDGGVQVDHPDLAAALVPGYNAADRLAQSAGGSVGDVDGHGTFVSGLAAAVGNNMLDVVGMGWNFGLMPVRYYNTPGGGYLGDILDGVRWAADHGARIINVSQTGVEYEVVQTTGAYVKSKGGLLFWAAGNDGRDLSWFDWPDVIVVGATNSADGRPAWSAFGNAVDVFAPGENILSTGIVSVEAIGSGTSAATPIAAGIAGLLWSRFPGRSPSQIEAALFAGCVDLGAPGNDLVWGWGRVDSYSTVTHAFTCPPDFDGDGFLTGDDFDAYVTAFVAGSRAADFDGDGFVTGDDFDAYVVAFSAGC